MEDGSIWPALLITVILIVMNGILSSAEIAMMGLNEAKLKREADTGERKAKLLLYMKQHPSNFLSTVQIGITLAGLLSGAFAADKLAQPIVRWAGGMGVQGSALSVIGAVATFLVTLLMTFFMLVFGELVPKRIAQVKPEQTARRAINLINRLSRVTKPVVKLLSAATNGVLKLMGIDPDQEETVTEEDILLMMRQGQEQGEIEAAEVAFLSNLFAFSELAVEDAMIHRTELELLSINSSLEEAVTIIAETGHNKFPVIGESVDDIRGILYTKDLVALYPGAKKSASMPAIRDVMRQPCFVPEDKPLVTLFSEMKLSGERMAIVVDEYGGTSGIITLMDIITEIVGDIEVIEGATELSDGAWAFNGLIDIEDVFQLLGLELGEAEHDTLSGFLISRLGYIPRQAQTPSVDLSGWRFEVQEADGARIRTVLAQKNQLREIAL